MGLGAILFFLNTVAVPQGAVALEPLTLKEHHCYRYRNKKSWTTFQKQIQESQNRLSFSNYGGGWRILKDNKPLVSGVCWWHSRFQRSATYLAIFDPRAKKPTQVEVVKIIDDLAHFRKRVVIGGFENLSQFSEVYGNEIQAELESWVERDSLRGLMRSINPLRESFKLSEMI